MGQKKNPAAVELGSRGGKARAKSLSAKELSAIGKKGGKARKAALTPEQRREIARKAIRARWARFKGQK